MKTKQTTTPMLNLPNPLGPLRTNVFLGGAADKPLLEGTVWTQGSYRNPVSTLRFQFVLFSYVFLSVWYTPGQNRKVESSKIVNSKVSYFGITNLTILLRSV